ncbi:hypothetical protein CPB83DRAFT_843014 [Crepidotus variabilis]|uniref:Uncharacterized protein n=1 Tax=Crepidotus variabilis TaxID=179855 RepID=A0A9P6ET91_9AGAR|nr:hypothetical protein CPB83DRAFT_843014 [Crepidotus variabilis]
MSFNNASFLVAIGSDSSNPTTMAQHGRHPRRRVTSDPCLPERLPTSGFIQREAESLAPQELTKQLIKTSMEEQADSEPTVELEEPPVPEARPRTLSSPRSAAYVRSFVKSLIGSTGRREPANGWTNVQPFEVMKAVEDRDLMFLMEVRDKAFSLLLQSSGGETPLVHAIRIGNKDVAIVLLGAFSRWVNRLEDEDIQKPKTQSLLKALRVGLKLAINEGLAKSQSDLIASFMQTLIMSEGDKWVFAQVSTIARALNAGSDGKPVQAAGEAVRKFATKELGKADLIASLEDYIANATADLLVLGAWSNVLQVVKVDLIPSSYFARDDRVYKNFVEKLDRSKPDIQRRCNRRLRWQLSILKEGLEGRTETFRRKVELLSQQLDEGDGP